MPSNDWWSKKLGGQSTPSYPATGPSPYSQPYIPRPIDNSQPVVYDAPNDRLVAKAPSSRETDRCPGCYSSNYFAPQGTSKKRCYDCGYPIIQSGSGAGMPSGNGGGPVLPARQVSTSNNYNPSNIIGKIG